MHVCSLRTLRNEVVPQESCLGKRGNLDGWRSWVWAQIRCLLVYLLLIVYVYVYIMLICLLVDYVLLVGFGPRYPRGSTLQELLITGCLGRLACRMRRRSRCGSMAGGDARSSQPAGPQARMSESSLLPFLL